MACKLENGGRHTPEEIEQFVGEQVSEVVKEYLFRQNTPQLRTEVKAQVVKKLRVLLEKFLLDYGEPRVRVCAAEDPAQIIIRVGDISANIFRARTGREPTNDDLDRANCPKEGAAGHWLCGWCAKCDLPRTMCGHAEASDD